MPNDVLRGIDAVLVLGVEDTSTAEGGAADALVSQYGDLAPSVDRVMEADLDDDQRGRALQAFSDSLDRPGDPNRDPRVAIANALK